MRFGVPTAKPTCVFFMYSTCSDSLKCCRCIGGERLATSEHDSRAAHLGKELCDVDEAVLGLGLERLDVPAGAGG